MIEVIGAKQVLSRTTSSLGIQGDTSDPRPLVGQALRRAVYIEAPCTRHHLERLVISALQPLSNEVDWSDIVSECLDDLIQYGDIFEMRIEDEDGRHGFRLWPAPPGFVKRYDNSLVLLGVAGEEISPAAEWPNKVQRFGALRILPPDTQNEPIALALGLPQLTEKNWLRAPDACTYAAFLSVWRTKLEQQPYSGAIEGLELLGSKGPLRGPKRRWSVPTSRDSGFYVGRRMQRYGNPRWCAVVLEGGRPTKLLDLAAKGDVERPCDIGWRLKAALDAKQGAPHHVEWVAAGDHVRAIFFHPLPSWAERRLAVIGEKSMDGGGLFGFTLPMQNAEKEREFLADRLWTTAVIKGVAT